MKIYPGRSSFESVAFDVVSPNFYGESCSDCRAGVNLRSFGFNEPISVSVSGNSPPLLDFNFNVNKPFVSMKVVEYFAAEDVEFLHAPVEIVPKTKGKSLPRWANDFQLFAICPATVIELSHDQFEFVYRIDCWKCGKTTKSWTTTCSNYCFTEEKSQLRFFRLNPEAWVSYFSEEFLAQLRREGFTGLNGLDMSLRGESRAFGYWEGSK